MIDDEDEPALECCCAALGCCAALPCLLLEYVEQWRSSERREQALVASIRAGDVLCNGIAAVVHRFPDGALTVLRRTEGSCNAELDRTGASVRMLHWLRKDPVVARRMGAAELDGAIRSGIAESAWGGDELRAVRLVRDRAARRIQAAWRTAIADPSKSVCRRRLMAEFDEIRDMWFSTG